MKKKTILELDRMSAEQFHAAPKLPLTVVLDNVRSLNNIGSIFRTCDAFAVERLVLCGISQPPPSPEIHKTALGAEDSVEWSHEPDVLVLVRRLKSEGVTVCAVEQVHHSVMLDHFHAEPSRRYAIVLGNEVKGVAQSVVDEADVCIEIPQHGTKHSLNISISAGIVIWDFFKQLFR